MSPDVSRRLGLLLGRHWVSPDERSRIISAALSAEDWEDIPDDVRGLLADIGQRGAAPVRGSGSHTSEADDEGPKRAYELLAPARWAEAADVTPGHDQLHHYWTRDPVGLKRWIGSTHPATTLHDLLMEHGISSERAWEMANVWTHEVTGLYPGSDAHRVAHGHPPRGNRIGRG